MLTHTARGQRSTLTQKSGRHCAVHCRFPTGEPLNLMNTTWGQYRDRMEGKQKGKTSSKREGEEGKEGQRRDKEGPVRPNKDGLYTGEGQMGVLFMVSSYTLREAPSGHFKAEEACMCVCVCSRLERSLGTTFHPQISPHFCSPRQHATRTSGCIQVLATFLSGYMWPTLECFHLRSHVRMRENATYPPPLFL